jgi:hypothetical protein
MRRQDDLRRGQRPGIDCHGQVQSVAAALVRTPDESIALDVTLTRSADRSDRPAIASVRLSMVCNFDRNTQLVTSFPTSYEPESLSHPRANLSVCHQLASLPKTA